MYTKKKDKSGKVKELLDSVNLNFKDTFGEIPKSIMKFKKDTDLMKLIDYDNNDIRSLDGDAKTKGLGYMQKIRL